MNEQYFITLPLGDLQKLASLPSQVEQLSRENNQLKNELVGLRSVLNQTMILVADLRREMGRA